MDEIKDHNWVGNLAWVDAKTNNNMPLHRERCAHEAKKVYCVELNKTFNSMTAAAIEFGISPSRISECCSGKAKTALGYHW